MNFKTTMVLLVALVIVGGVALYEFQNNPNPSGNTTVTQHKLIDLDQTAITGITIEPADGPKIVLQKQAAGDNGISDWLLTSPIDAKADATAVSGMLSQLLGLQSTATVDTSDGKSASFGLDHPQYQVTLTTADKSETLSVGSAQGIGNGVYVQLGGSSNADVVDTGVLDAVGKSANDLRDKKLTDVASATAITQVNIKGASGAVEVEKIGDKWAITAPFTAAADTDAMTDLTAKLSTLTADAFMDNDATSTALFGTPRLTVSFGTAAATQPSAADQPAGASQPSATSTTIEFGRYKDILKKDVYARITGSDQIETVPADTFDALNKSALDLRDKTIFTVAPDDATSITIAYTGAAPAKGATTIALNRRVKVVGPVAKAPAYSGPAATQTASTQSASTQAAATEPTTQPASTWTLSTNGGAPTDANDANVSTLLSAFNPLKADQYFAKLPTTLPTAAYTVEITTTGAGGSPVTRRHLTVIDTGAGQAPLATYNGLFFQAPRSLVDALSASFVYKPAAPGDTAGAGDSSGASGAAPAAGSPNDAFTPTR